MFTTVLLTALITSSTSSHNETYEVISHKKYQAEVSSNNEIWKIFTDRKRAFRDGVKIQPLLSSNDQIHRAFCNDSLGMTSHQFRTFWLRKRFTEPAKLPERSPSDRITRLGVQDRRNWIGVVASSATLSRLRHLNRPFRLRSGL